ncbi:MAG: hypothetical protein HC905_24065 [Bacteroidales bacterium]|nr:hypothetical protein [Bacteroidales bacterium]
MPNYTGKFNVKGKLLINSNSIFNVMTSNSTYLYFGGGIENAGLFIAGGATFTNDQTLLGNGVLEFNAKVLIDTATIIRNKARVYINSGTLNGSNSESTWINDQDSELKYSTTQEPMLTGDLVADATNNTVEYNCSDSMYIAHAGSNGIYYNLKVSGLGKKKIKYNIIATRLFLEGGNIVVDDNKTLSIDDYNVNAVAYSSGSILGKFVRKISPGNWYHFPVGDQSHTHSFHIQPTDYDTLTVEFKNGSSGPNGLPLLENLRRIPANGYTMKDTGMS